MRYLSLCSGIEAASVAVRGLPWEAVAFSEIEPFPCAVLAHHWPEVPNLGDMTKWREWDEDVFAAADLLVGGTPCQAFSIAGLRNSLSDERGNLTLTYLHVLDHIDSVRRARGLPPAACLWENVPGVLSTKDNAFGCFLGGLAGDDEPLVCPGGGKWPDCGVVVGTERVVAWRVIDSQGFVAQRRRRVFVVASRNALRLDPVRVLFESEAEVAGHLGDRAGRGPLFPEPEGVRRHPAAGGEAREGVAGTLAASTGGSDENDARDGRLVPSFWDGSQTTQTLDAVLQKGQTMPEKNRFPACLVPSALDLRHNTITGNTTKTIQTRNSSGSDLYNTPGALVPSAFANRGHHGAMVDTDESDPLRAKGGDTGNGGESLVAFSCKDYGADASEIAPTLRSMGHHESHANAGGQLAVAHTLRADGFDAGEDGTGRGTPLVPVAFEPRCARNGRGMPEEVVPPLKAQSGMTGKGDSAPCVTYQATRDEAAVLTGNYGKQPDNSDTGLGPNLAFAQESGQGWWQEDTSAGTLDANMGCSGHANRPGIIGSQMLVRRLTVTECEFLMGFQEGHTKIPWRGKPADACPDGVRYKALGNSMVVDVVRWICERIEREATI